MTPAQRVHLARRIAETGFFELDPHGEPPEWLSDFLSGGSVPRIWTMTAAGERSDRWEWLDAISWPGVVAVYAEYDSGQPIDLAIINLDEEDCW